MYIDHIGMLKEEELLNFFVKDNLITSALKEFCFSERTDIFCLELNHRKQKRLLFCCYSLYKHLIKDHLLQIKNGTDFYSKFYENIVLLGDFNADISDSLIDSFCAIYLLKSFFKGPTCYKNPDNSTYIDLILSNSSMKYQAML